MILGLFTPLNGRKSGGCDPLYKTMESFMQKKKFFIGIFVLIATISFCVGGCGEEERRTIIAEDRIEVYEDYRKDKEGKKRLVRESSKQDFKVLYYLNKGERVKVLKEIHAKDGGYLKVKLSDGREGYMVYGINIKFEKEN